MLLKCAVALLPKGIQYDIIVKDAQNVRLGASLTYFFELLTKEAIYLQRSGIIKVKVKRKMMEINADTVFYVIMSGKYAHIHIAGGKVHVARITLAELEEQLGDDFVKVDRGCIVSAMAIHKIAKKILLNNGESLDYAKRKKKQIEEIFRTKQKNIIGGFSAKDAPSSFEEYRSHYKCFDGFPFAFADIEMVFDEKNRAVDWIFRYGNEALSRLEKIPLDKLINKSFAGLFRNMSSKWLRNYERSTLYGETLQTVDYSPEVDRYLNVISFPTFEGHCGCILFDINDIQYVGSGDDAGKALGLYFGNTLPKE